MTIGKSEFPVRINRKAIADITDRRQRMRPLLEAFEAGFAQTAPKNDYDTYMLLVALIEYLKERRVEPDFQVVLDE